MSNPNIQNDQVVYNKTGRDSGWVSDATPPFVRAVKKGISFVCVPTAGKTMTLSESDDGVSWTQMFTISDTSQFIVDHDWLKIEGNGDYVVG